MCWLLVKRKVLEWFLIGKGKYHNSRISAHILGLILTFPLSLTIITFNVKLH